MQFGQEAALSTIKAREITASGDDDDGYYSGSAYIFTRTGSVWTKQAKLTAGDAAAYDRFGTSASVSGDTALIAAKWDDHAGGGWGSVYIFTRTGSVWTQQAKLFPGDGPDFFGSSVSLSDDTALIGARGDDDAGDNAGSSYIFTRAGSVWTQQTKLTAGDATAAAWFGSSVSLSGDTALIGAYLDNDESSYPSSAYVFVRAGPVWIQKAKLTDGDDAGGNFFGSSVSLSGDTALVGAYLEDGVDMNGGPAPKQGSVYIFRLDKGPPEISVSAMIGAPSSNTTFEIWNSGSSNLNYSLSSDSTWMTLSPISGNSTGEFDTITVEYNTNGLASGNYEAQINIVSVEAYNSPTNIDVFLTISNQTGGFETDLGIWTNSTGFDIHWTRRSGSTPSSDTGPSNASEGSYYIYTEATNPNHPSKAAAIESSFDFSTVLSPLIQFDYHMYGASMGSLFVDVFNGSWHNAEWSLSGQQHSGHTDPWKKATVDLSAYGNMSNITIRVRGITGSDYASDMAVDNIVVRGAQSPDIQDTDDDGIPDWWETQYYGGATNANPSATSSNGVNTVIEAYIAGFDPTDPNAGFGVESVEKMPEGFVVNWSSVTGRVYDVLWTQDLNRGFQLLTNNLEYPVNSYTDTMHSASSSGYYMVAVRLPGMTGDMDGDGLPDMWELGYFSDSVSAVAGYDFDGDGQSNIDEYIAGTNPTNSASLFKATKVWRMPAGIVVEWLSVTGRVYSVLWSDAPAGSYSVMQPGIEHPQNSYTDTTHNAESTGFYKLDVKLK